MNCPLCGKEVKAIALNSEECAFCEAGLVEIVAESGRAFKGYIRHRCEDGKEKDTGESRG